MAAACRILCATMLPVTVAAGLVFRKRIRQTGSIAPGAIAMGPAATAAAAADALCWSEPQAGSRRQRIDRRGGGSVRVRVHGEDDKIPPIKTVAPDLPLDVLRHIRRACRHAHAGTRTLAHTQLQPGAAHPPPLWHDAKGTGRSLPWAIRRDWLAKPSQRLRSRLFAGHSG